MVLAVLAPAVPKLLPRLCPTCYASTLYRTYADVPGIDATFLKNFPLNDTLTIDVTILQATDSAGWERLKADFSIKDYPPEALPYIDTAVASFKYAPKRDYTLEQDSVILNNDCIAISRSRRNVSVFDLQRKEQLDAILFYKVNQQNKKNHGTP